jgi:hypothetical protein
MDRCEKFSGATNAFASVVENARAGRLKYDGARARACLDALSKLSCAAGSLAQFDGHLACEGAIEGTVPAGGACLESSECEDGGRCNKSACPADQACCEGVCEPRRRAGSRAPCASSSECSAGEHCQEGEAGRTCQPPIARGEPCTGLDTCVVGTSCRGAPGRRTCAPLAKDGEPCESLADCASLGSHCAAGEKVCRPRASVGAPCSHPGGCVGLTACVNGRCENLPAPGEACTERSDDPALAPSTGCTIGRCENGQCTVPAAPPACR